MNYLSNGDDDSAHDSKAKIRYVGSVKAQTCSRAYLMYVSNIMIFKVSSSVTFACTAL